jgi:hypothetical protein
MTYEIRVVFQSAQAYQSAIEGLYRAFGVEVSESGLHHAVNGTSEGDVDPMLPRPVVSLDSFLAEDPALVGDGGYTFTVEDQTPG